MLRISGFMDDVTFGHSGPYGGCCDTGAESDVYECLVDMINACFIDRLTQTKSNHQERSSTVCVV